MDDRHRVFHSDGSMFSVTVYIFSFGFTCAKNV